MQKVLDFLVFQASRGNPSAKAALRRLKKARQIVAKNGPDSFSAMMARWRLTSRSVEIGGRTPALIFSASPQAVANNL